MADAATVSPTTKESATYRPTSGGNIALQSTGLATAVTKIQTMSSLFQGQLAALDTYFESVRQTVRAVQDMIRSRLQPMLEAVRALWQPLSLLVSFKSIYYVAPTPTAAPPIADKTQVRQYLPVANNDFGFFVIDGKPLKILHPVSSRPGKILATLLRFRSRVATYEELREAIGSGDFRKDFKDLKYQLRKRGYALDYELVRTKGVALLGLSQLQQ